jgi:hypothetical protein|tara:strand:- start:127 stop:1293 length:1167 start_codon:yes stop_codon:yes gene_type:complete
MLENTIEDCLELLAGFRKESDNFSLMKEDYTIMHSIARQVFKGTALTDRQFALMQTKLLAYKDQFDNADIPLEINKLRHPLREINREKYITLKNDKIKVRFPFKKSDIMLINEISHKAKGYNHKKGSHEHFFDYTEINVLNILNRFAGKSFKIDTELVEVYHEMKHMEAQKEKYVPGIFDMQIRNVNQSAKELMESDIGKLNDDTFLKYADRKFKYGLAHIDVLDPKNITESIAFRNTVVYESKPSIETLDQLLGSLWQLDRFPMLVILSKDKAELQLHSMLTYYRDILNSDQQSVLFRLDDKNAGFNHLVKDRKVNNWVDKSTKIVYISKDKLPKLLVNCECKPTVALCFDSMLDKTLDTFVTDTCDLVIFREEYLSPFRRHSSIYG